jgi:MFS family permease
VRAERKPDLLINRNFALLWAGGFISVFGDLLFATTLVVWISTALTAHQSWAPLAVSGVLLATLVPTLALGPLAGVFVDRWNRRRTMLWMDALRAFLIVLLLLATNSVPLPFMPGGSLSLVEQLSAIYGCVFFASLSTQFFGPARLALIGEIVPDAHRARASGLTQVARSLATIAAPPLAPILLLTAGPQVALLVNALSFALSFTLLLAMRVPRTIPKPSPDEHASVLREFLAALKVAVQSRVSLTLLVALSIVMLGFSALNALDIFFVLGNLHAPVTLFGFMETAQGGGAILGALGAGMFAQRIGLVRTLTGSLLLTGVCILFYSRMTTFAPAMIVVFLCGFFLAALSVAAGPLLLRVAPGAYVGRIVAIIEPTSALMQVLGTLLAGALVSTLLLGFHVEAFGVSFGPIDTVFAGGAVLILIGACYGLLRLGFTDSALPAAVPPAARRLLRHDGEWVDSHHPPSRQTHSPSDSPTPELNRGV